MESERSQKIQDGQWLVGKEIVEGGEEVGVRQSCMENTAQNPTVKQHIMMIDYITC